MSIIIRQALDWKPGTAQGTFKTSYNLRYYDRLTFHHTKIDCVPVAQMVAQGANNAKVLVFDSQGTHMLMEKVSLKKQHPLHVNVAL